jgi:hypothetical protein
MKDGFGLIRLLETLGPDICRAIVDGELTGEKINEYLELGTIPEVEKVLNEASNQLEAWKAIGAPPGEVIQDIDRATNLIESYTSLGPPQQLKAMVENLNKLREQSRQKQIQENITTLSRKHNVPQSTVRTLLEKNIAMKEVDQILTETRTGRRQGTPRLQRRVSEGLEETPLNEDLNEVVETTSKSASERFFESLDRGIKA